MRAAKLARVLDHLDAQDGLRSQSVLHLIHVVKLDAREENHAQEDDET